MARWIMTVSGEVTAPGWRAIGTADVAPGLSRRARVAVLLGCAATPSLGAAYGDVRTIRIGAVIAVWVVTVAWMSRFGPGSARDPKVAFPHQFAPSVVLSMVTALALASNGTTIQSAVPTGVGLVVALAPPRVAAMIDRFGRWFGAAVSTAVAAVSFGVLGAMVTFASPRWLHRGTRTNAWLGVARATTGLRERWTVDAGRTPPRPHAARRPVGIAAALALAAGGVQFARGGDGFAASASRIELALRLGAFDPSAPVPRAFAAADWFVQHRRDVAWALDERVALRPFEIYRVLDNETDTMDVRDGIRRSWGADGCTDGTDDCRRVRVWWYGGSAAFGFGQRDEHTVASEFARAAAVDGVTVDVSNRSVPGTALWRSVLRFEWDLARESPPDLVVFYTGIEDAAAADELIRSGKGNTLAPFERFNERLYDEVVATDEELAVPPDNVVPLGWPTLDDKPWTVESLATERFGRSRLMSDRAADLAGVVVRYVSAPIWPTSPDASLADRRVARAAIGSGSSAQVSIDLTSAVHRSTQFFADATRHNERASAVAGRALASELSDTLRRLASGAPR